MDIDRDSLEHVAVVGWEMRKESEGTQPPRMQIFWTHGMNIVAHKRFSTPGMVRMDRKRSSGEAFWLGMHIVTMWTRSRKHPYGVVLQGCLRD